MATLRQKKVAKAIVEAVALDNPPTKQEIVESAGYSYLTADRRARNVIDSKGVQDELVSIGFTSDKAKEVVAEILIAGENDTVKLKAADMIFKIHGEYAPDKHITLNLDEQSTERTHELGNRMLGLLRRGN